MEKKTPTKKASSKKKTESDIKIINNPDGSIICGWDSLDSCVDTVKSSNHYNLLDGYLVFGYNGRRKDNPGPIWIVIVKNRFDDFFSIGIVTSGWTSYYPKAPRMSLDSFVLYNFKKWEIEDNIIEIYKQLLEKLK